MALFLQHFKNTTYFLLASMVFDEIDPVIHTIVLLEGMGHFFFSLALFRFFLCLKVFTVWLWCVLEWISLNSSSWSSFRNALAIMPVKTGVVDERFQISMHLWFLFKEKKKKAVWGERKGEREEGRKEDWIGRVMDFSKKGFVKPMAVLEPKPFVARIPHLAGLAVHLCLQYLVTDWEQTMIG